MSSVSSPLHLTAMYLDTTFCEPRALYIPNRVESAEAAISIARDWLNQGPEYHLHIANKAGLGYEQLYKEMAGALGMKVCTSCFLSFSETVAVLW